MLKKFLSLLTLFRYGKLPVDIRYFYRNTYYCQLIQFRYFFEDFVLKRKYKTLVFDGEFGQELLFVLPFAYWHFKNGTLKNTVGCNFTKELYFFSPDHTEKYDVRREEGNYNFSIPRVLFSQNYNIKKWLQVPLKDQYRNDHYVFEKPIIIIANRYNQEWGGPPVSYFDIDMLSFLIENLKGKYTIIYNRPRPHHITMDNSDIYDLDEYAWLQREYPEVLLMENLFKENTANARNFNHLQLMVYANSEHFVSVHGGTATLASYFGGVNLIFSKKGLEHHFGCFHRLFPRLSGATILHAKTENEVKGFVGKYF